MNGVHIDNGIQALQWPVLPFTDLWDDTVRYAGDGAIADIYTIHFLNVRADVTVAHSVAVKSQDLAVKVPWQDALALGNGLGLKTTVAVAGRKNLNAAQ